MSTATSHWNRVSRRLLADVLDELHTARTLTFDEHRPGIVIMSVNRPSRANSQTVEMFGEIAWATALLRNAPLHALIVTGAGGKAFCTGFDLDEVDVLTRMSVSEFTDLVETAAAGSTGLRALPIPFRKLLLGVGVFGAGDFSHTLLILYATKMLTPAHGLAKAASIAVGLYTLHNIFYAGSAYLSDWLSDYLPQRKYVLAAGYALAGVTALLLCSATQSLWLLAVIFVIGGLYGAEVCLYVAVAIFGAQALVILLSPAVALPRQPEMVSETDRSLQTC